MGKLKAGLAAVIVGAIVVAMMPWAYIKTRRLIAEAEADGRLPTTSYCVVDDGE